MMNLDPVEVVTMNGNQSEDINGFRPLTLYFTSE